jgi:hypothetical protein
VRRLLEPEDERGVSPMGYVRRVTGHNLWLWYIVDRTGDVVAVTLTRSPPTSDF